jgi:CRISPR/Cas system CMR-associated protein Cmr3 (group 5 of RAMP superfamily)
MRREEILKKIELEEAGGSTLTTLRKREIINKIRRENEKMIYDQRYLRIQDSKKKKETPKNPAEREAMKLAE